MSRRLSDETIAARMVELRNLRRLHLLAGKRAASQQVVIAIQKGKIATLKEQIAILRQLVDTQNIRIAELETMVFGKKHRPPTGTAVPELPVPARQPRDAASYRRPVPDDSLVTATERCPVVCCTHCGGKLRDCTEHVRYEEDIPLPELTPGYVPLLVTKYLIAKGICSACGRTTSARPLGGAEVSLGPNVRLLASDLISRMGMSYSQVSGLLLGLYGLSVSDGELAALLQAKHQDWLSAYSGLQNDIRAAPVRHYDETPWNIQELQGAGYAWVLADAGSEAVCFALESSRGARHAQTLHGDSRADSVYVTDDYAAYRNLPGLQQLCWAHLYRVTRDLVYNDNLPKEQQPYVTAWYASFAGIYGQLREYLAEPYDQARRQQQAEALWRQLSRLAHEAAPASGEPDKLRRLKAQLIRAGKDRLFVCLEKDTPCDNNRAERDLRQLVLKRKRSFGSKTEKGATALATLLSLCTTTWRRAQRDGNPAGYFSRLAALGG